MRRPDRLDPGRGTVDSQRDRRDRQSFGRTPQVRLSVHQRAPGREEDRPVRAQPAPHLLDPSGRPARAPRPLGLPGRRVRSGGERDPPAARPRLSRQRQRHPVRRRGAGGGRGVLRLRDDGARRRGHHGLARLRLRAGARPGPISSTGARPSSCSATSSVAAAASAGASITRRSISTSSPAIRNTIARPGAIRPATSSAGSAPAICSARATRAPSRS